MPEPTLPFLDMTATGFSTRSDAVHLARAAAPLARTPYGVAVLRYREAGLLLRDRRLRQGSHAWPEMNGLSGPFAQFWQRSVISQEGAVHKAQRRIVQAALRPEDIDAHIPDFEACAEDLADGLAAPGDVVERFTEPYAGRAITTLLDMPTATAADLATDASALGLAMGPACREHQSVFNAACARLMGLAEGLIQRAEAGDDPRGMVGRMVTHPGALDDRQLLRDLVVISIFGGVDTTRAQLAFALDLFCDHPEQWTWLRAHPEAVPHAIDEVIRTRPTTTWASREALEDIDFAGQMIAAGTTVHILVHASGTDPALETRDGFDIRARRKSHWGFGGGAHHCLGQYVARTDMAAALRVLLARYTRIERAGVAEYLPDSGNTSPLALPLVLRA